MTDSSLHDYRRKRDFSLTDEPDGEAPHQAEKSAGRALAFVVQKHAARALHYDFRLELDGTLKSWAVPKGPSLDPKHKRMAVQVEDHPLAYATFEGRIPPGQYGAGTVTMWDRGEWLPVGNARAGYKAGKLKFELRGEKLKGRWTLVRMSGHEDDKQPPWLLIKERDGFASTKEHPQASASLPLKLAPQLATLVDRLPEDEKAWSWEMKLDGYRLLARVDGAEVRLFTRNGLDWTGKLKNIAAALAELKLGSAWLDGEIVVQEGPHGAPSFQALQNAFEKGRSEGIHYYLFDLPFHAGEDLRERPLKERRQRLRGLLESAQEPLRFSEDFDAPPAHLLRSACKAGLEGLIGKRVDSPYRSERSPDWIKLKCGQRQEFVVIGHTAPRGTREGFGALLLAVHDAAGALRYAGSVGSGFGVAALRSLKQKMDEIPAANPPVDPPEGLKARWVRPRLVVEVSFSEWTQDGRLRHPVFQGVRGDKPADDITRERALPLLPSGLKLSNPTRVIDSSTGITKQELAEFYASVGERMLPHLKGRPVSLVRAPDGLDGELFFQKHGSDTLARITGFKSLDPQLDPGHEPLLQITRASALPHAVQMNVIEFHTWNACSRSIEQPSRICFDLDPGEGVSWPQVQEGAQLLRAMLEELSLQGFLKTSGGKGLHVIVPIRRGPSWGVVKGLARTVVEHLAATIPQRFVAKSGPKNRVGKIYVDYLRNGRGATTACAWTARARPGMGVSVPVAWEELPKLTGGDHWTVRTVAQRLAEPDEAWAAWPKFGGQGLSKAMLALGFVA